MQKILKAGNTIYNSHDYDCDDGNTLCGNLFDYRLGKDRYQKIAKDEKCDDSYWASQIVQLLPDEDTIKRCTLTGMEASRNDKLMRYLLREMSNADLEDDPTPFD